MGLIVNFIWWLAESGTPLTDQDGLGLVAYHFPPLAEALPGLEPIDYNKFWRDSSLSNKILFGLLLVVPLFDLEFLKMIGWNPMSDYQKSMEEIADLEPAEFDKTAGGSRTAARGPQRPSGGGGKALSSVGTVLKYLALIAAPILMVFVALTVAGGSGYGSLAQDAVGNELAGVNFDTGFSMISEGVQTLQCFGNAACLRAWRFNNTERPGSEEVGQSYNLQVDEFSVNDGNELDISGRRGSFSLPVGFSLYNPRHGLKGIPARGTEYRIRIEDLGNREDGAYCGTGWRTIGGQYASDIEGVEPGTIVPGGFATPISGMQDLNLSSCGLLQPALGLTRRVALDVKYNYSSQATLYFEAMSQENLRSLGERPDFKQSETADTPVKSYVNVESPVTFRQESGERASRVFRVRLGMSTDRHDISYRFNPEEFRLYDSSKTVDVDSVSLNTSTATCDGLQRAEGEDAYKLSETMINFTERQYERGKWFSKGSGMSPVSCSMVLDEEELSTISPSGETLTMRIDANYTVRVEKSNDGFKTINGRCSDTEYNCPLLVSDHKTDENDALVSECSTSKRVDAADGCDVRKGENWHRIDIINENSVDEEIEQGDTAYLWREKKKELRNNKDSWINSSQAGAFGITEEENEILEEGNGALVMDDDFGEGDDVRVDEISSAVCRSTGDETEYREIWEDNNDVDSMLFFNPRLVDCGNNSELEDLFSFLFETTAERYENAKKDCNVESDEQVVTVDDSGFTCETTV